MSNVIQYHIGIKQNEIGEYVILTGDPKRIDAIAKMLDSYKEVGYNREFRTVTGYITGYNSEKIKISVVSTGIGCPSAAICIEELINIGAKVLIRIGTAGSLQPNIKVGDIVIATATVREDGTTKQYVPKIYPAVSNIKVVNSLIEAAEKLNVKYHLGITHCKDAFYTELPEITPLKEENEKNWKVWQRSNVLATEMESSALFVIGSIRKVSVGTILKIVGETYSKKTIVKNFSIENLAKIAIESIKIFENKYKSQ